MDFDPQNVMYFFAAVTLAFGCHGLLMGSVTFTPGEDDSRAVTIQGLRARILGLAFILASLLLASGNEYGYLALVAAMILGGLFALLD